MPWRRGAGYDVERLTDVLTVNDAYARVVLQELARRTGDPTQVRALGFCVSVRHARFMARVFNEAGIKATAVWADTPDAERRAALRDLKHGTVNVLFSVDLFNEGVDVPVVDTLLFLRPTDSPTLFLQQLGRGNLSWTELRQAAGLATATAGPADDHLLRACGRLLHIDDQRRIAAYREVFNLPPLTHFESLSPTTRTFVQMLVASLAGGAVSKNDRISAGLHLLQSHGRVRDEMLAVLDVLESRISHATLPLATHPGVPLEVHARYSRLEILAAFGLRETAKMPPWQTGVYWARSARADLLAFTLDKTSGGFSPTTRYRDYALGRDRAASSR